MPVLVDGYNLLHCVQKSDDRFCALTAVGLCKIICEYLDVVDDRGCIVFDGTGHYDSNEQQLLSNLGNIEVFFSGVDKNADTLIEEKIRDNSAPRRLVVVSSDRQIRSAANKRKATSVTAEAFWSGLLSKLSDSNKPAPEPKEKRSGLTEGETDVWLGFFGLDD